MRQGKVVEEGLASRMLAAPQSAYTRALFAAAFEHDVRPFGADV
jgi:microcin C transport system ATP-binding protein